MSEDKDIIEMQKLRWNEMHSNYERDKLTYDNWLDLFNKDIDTCNTPIIDLGCGSGNDTLYLTQKGKEVIPCDYTENAIKNIIKNFPEIKEAKCFEMTEGLPFEDEFTDIIIADLSLHYFKEKETFKILEDIKRVLKPNGLLLLRLNSINDIYCGAGEGTEIEKHLYQTKENGYKRFFDEEDIRYFFIDWEKIYIKEEIMKRYRVPKKLWTVALRKNK